MIYLILKFIISGLMHLVYRYRASGQENVPASGRVILVVNHLHLFDPGAVMPAVNRKIVTMAKTEYRTNMLWGIILRLAGVIFVRRGEADRDALRASYDVLDHEGCLAIAPEGTRSKTGALQEAKPGISYIATRKQAPIVPIAIWGIENLRHWSPFKRPECRVVVGRPFCMPTWHDRMTAGDLQQLADLTMIRIGLLLPERYRGVYADRIAAIENGTSSEPSILLDN
ncbi:MAG: lysophospholipid acyltransferase family protein [Anaerolineae bacterium]